MIGTDGEREKKIRKIHAISTNLYKVMKMSLTILKNFQYFDNVRNNSI